MTFMTSDAKTNAAAPFLNQLKKLLKNPVHSHFFAFYHVLEVSTGRVSMRIKKLGQNISGAKEETKTKQFQSFVFETKALLATD